MLQRSLMTLGGNASRRRASRSMYKYLAINLQTRKESVAEQRFLKAVAKAQRQREKQITSAIKKAAAKGGPIRTPRAGTGLAYHRNVHRAEHELRRLAAARRERVEAALAAAEAAKGAGAVSAKSAVKATAAATRATAHAGTLTTADAAFFRRLDAARAKRIAAVERMLEKQDTAPAEVADDVVDVELPLSTVAEAVEPVRSAPARRRRPMKSVTDVTAAVTPTPMVALNNSAASRIAEEGNGAAQAFLQRLEEEAQHRRAMIESALAEKQQQREQAKAAAPKRTKAARVTTVSPPQSSVRLDEAEAVAEPKTVAAAPRIATTAPAAPRQRTAPRAKDVVSEAPVPRVDIALPPRLVDLRAAPPRRTAAPASPVQPVTPARVVVQVPLATTTGLFRI